MYDRWKIGKYEFSINPNRYSEKIDMIGDNVRTLDGTLVVQPTSTQETYNITSIFFQNRPRILSEVSIGKADGIEFINNKFYTLDSSTLRVNVYSSNLSRLEKYINIVATDNGEKIVAFDVLPDETIWAVEKASSAQYIHKINGSARVKKQVSGIMGDIVGIKQVGSSLWVATSMNKLYRLIQSDMSSDLYTELPDISFASYGYKGMTSIGNYILVTYSNLETSGVVYIDSSNGNICNNFYLPEYREIRDVGYNGKDFIFLMNKTNTIVFASGNTVLLDIYELEKEIKSYGFVSMVDDMGVTKRVSVSSYSIERQEGNLSKYEVSITIDKVGRGLN